VVTEDDDDDDDADDGSGGAHNIDKRNSLSENWNQKS